MSVEVRDRQVVSDQPIKPIVGNEVEAHPAFCAISKKTEAEQLLRGTPPLSYIIWIERSTNLSTLSFMDISLTIDHQSFYYPCLHGSLRQTSSLDQLIPQLMKCKVTDCKMVLKQ